MYQNVIVVCASLLAYETPDDILMLQLVKVPALLSGSGHANTLEHSASYRHLFKLAKLAWIKDELQQGFSKKPQR